MQYSHGQYSVVRYSGYRQLMVMKLLHWILDISVTATSDWIKYISKTEEGDKIDYRAMRYNTLQCDMMRYSRKYDAVWNGEDIIQLSKRMSY